MINFTQNQWYNGKKPCKHCGAMSVKYRKWYDLNKQQMGKKYICNSCDENWWEKNTEKRRWNDI